MATIDARIQPSPVRRFREPSRDPSAGERRPADSADEFERRYDAMPELKKAELIEGVVYMTRPISPPGSRTARCSVAIDLASRGSLPTRRPREGTSRATTARSDSTWTTCPSPTILFILPEYGGQARISDGRLCRGRTGTGRRGRLQQRQQRPARKASKSIAATASANTSSGGSRDAAIDWFVLRDDGYERLEPSADGISAARSSPASGSTRGPDPGDLARVSPSSSRGWPRPSTRRSSIDSDEASRADRRTTQPRGDRP